MSRAVEKLTIRMPWSQKLQGAEVGELHCQSGDLVRAEQPVLSITSEDGAKALTAIHDGQVVLLVAPGDPVAEGDALYVLHREMRASRARDRVMRGEEGAPLLERRRSRGAGALADGSTRMVGFQRKFRNWAWFMLALGAYALAARLLIPQLQDALLDGSATEWLWVLGASVVFGLLMFGAFAQKGSEWARRLTWGLAMCWAALSTLALADFSGKPGSMQSLPGLATDRLTSVLHLPELPQPPRNVPSQTLSGGQQARGLADAPPMLLDDDEVLALRDPDEILLIELQNREQPKGVSPRRARELAAADRAFLEGAVTAPDGKIVVAARDPAPDASVSPAPQRLSPGTEPSDAAQLVPAQTAATLDSDGREFERLAALDLPDAAIPGPRSVRDSPQPTILGLTPSAAPGPEEVAVGDASAFDLANAAAIQSQPEAPSIFAPSVADDLGERAVSDLSAVVLPEAMPDFAGAEAADDRLVTLGTPALLRDYDGTIPVAGRPLTEPLAEPLSIVQPSGRATPQVIDGIFDEPAPQADPSVRLAALTPLPGADEPAPLPWLAPRFTTLNLLFQYVEDPRTGGWPEIGASYQADLPPEVAIAVTRSEVVDMRSLLQVTGWCVAARPGAAGQEEGSGTPPPDGVSESTVALTDRLRLVLVEIEIEADTIGLLSDALPVFGQADVGFFHNRRPMMGGYIGTPLLDQGEAWLRARANRVIDPNFPDLPEGGSYFFAEDDLVAALKQNGCTNPIWQGGEPASQLGQSVDRALLR